MVLRYDDGGGGLPADLEKTAAAAAASAAVGSKSSYTKTIKLSLVKGRKYKFYFAYLHEDPDTKEVKKSDWSPVWTETFDIPNLTKAVQNLTLSPGFKSYGVKFDIDPTSVQEDVVIFESLTGSFTGEEYIVYVGVSTNITIQTSDYAPRWVRVRSRDRWDDLNITNVSAGPVTPLNAEIDTTAVPLAPSNVTVNGSIDPDDLSGFSVKITAAWTASTDLNTNGYVIRWSTQDPSIVTNPVWEYGQVDGRETNTFSITGLVPNTKYYWQVTAKSPFNTISWAAPQSGTVGPIVDSNAPADVWSQLRSIISIGGKTANLFKIGTGISQTVNTSTTITPTQTAGTYSGIIMNTSTTNVGHNYWLNTGQFRVGSASAFLYWDGSDLYTTGKINATGGTFTGNLRVTTGSIIAGGTFAQNGTVSGARVVLQPSGLFAHDSTGAQSVVIQSADGLIDARKGYIGGWTINATSQQSGTISRNNTILDSNGNITVGDTTGTLGSIVRLSATDPTFRIWVGSQVASNAKFRVASDGTLYATGAVIGLGAGSTIDGYATTASLGNYTLTTVTSGINSRLQTVEGAYVSVSTLNTGLSTKNTTFYTDTNTPPSATKAGDLWINGGDNNELYTAGAAGTGFWTKRTNTRYATTTDLNSKLNATSYIVQRSSDNFITMNTSGMTIQSGSTTNGVIFNSDGIAAYSNGSPTFTLLSSNGSASFKGNIDGSSITGGTIAIGVDEGSSGYINTNGTKGGVTTMVIKAIGHASSSTSGWTTSCYPWDNGTYSLGTDQYSWNNLYLAGGAFFADGTTIKIDANGYATLNRITLTGGYGVYSDWSPGPDSTYSLGLSSRRWQDVWAIDTSINASDIRLKRDIQESNLGLSFINRLKPISYKWKESKRKPVLEEKIEIIDTNREDKREQVVMMPKIIGYDENGGEIIETTAEEGVRNHYGFIAQEVKEALDLEGVGDSFAGWVLDDHLDPESRQNLRYSEFISPLTRAVQELSDMVESLQEEINILKGI